MKFKIDKLVFEKFPNLVVAIPIVLGFDNSQTNETGVKFLREQEEEVKKKYDLEATVKDLRIGCYFDAFTKFGVDPTVSLPTHWALTKRVLEGGQIPDINPIVDLYNGMSIKYLTPFGGEDLDQVCGDFRLEIASGGEKWIPIGSKKGKPCVAGELIWEDDFDVSTRALNWRQCERTKLTSKSKNGYFIMDGFEGVNKDNIEKAANEFLELVTKNFGGQGKVYWLTKENPEIEIDFKSKKPEDLVVAPVEKKTIKTRVVIEESMMGEIEKVLKQAGFEAEVTRTTNDNFGDYTTNVAMTLAKELQKSPIEIAKEIVKKIEKIKGIKKVEVVGGYINFFVEGEKLIDAAVKMEMPLTMKGKKIMVEYAHPNTHKELHIGHMRTLITGESLARILEYLGAEVFRANYQGDIGPHVAKAIWGTEKILKEARESFEDWEKKPSSDKAHLLGKGYALGCAEYEINKEEIDLLNRKLFDWDKSVEAVYQLTRRWSLEYYADFYKRFYTEFDKLFFESEVINKGKEVAESLLGNILERSQGAIIFDGEKYDLHKRVFVTAQGVPTYEGKELGLAYAQRQVFEYNRNIHVVANEQTGYFKVVIKAMELLDRWFIGRQYHLPMGMVNLVGKKMSSRTGEVITVDDLLDEVKATIRLLIKPEGKDKEEIEEVAEKATIAAVKFSVLKTDPKLNSIFDIKKSVDTEGDSGPYLQYTFARCASVIGKSRNKNSELRAKNLENIKVEELGLVRELGKFPEKVVEAGERLAPSVVAEYLLALARKYNEFYNKYRIIGEPEEEWRLWLTQKTAETIKKGLGLLGIAVVERM